MELICHELQIPTKFIKEIDENRFEIHVPKSWLKNLGQNGKVGSFLDTTSIPSSNNWQKIFITVCNTSVSPLKTLMLIMIFLFDVCFLF